MKHMTVYNHFTPEMLENATDGDGNLKLPLPASLKVPASEMMIAAMGGPREEGEEDGEEEEEEMETTPIGVDPMVANGLIGGLGEEDEVDQLLGAVGMKLKGGFFGGGGGGGGGKAGSMMTGCGNAASVASPASSDLFSNPNESFADCISALKAAFNFNGGLDNFNVQDFLSSAASAAATASSSSTSDSGVASLLEAAFNEPDELNAISSSISSSSLNTDASDGSSASPSSPSSSSFSPASLSSSTSPSTSTSKNSLAKQSTAASNVVMASGMTFKTVAPPSTVAASQHNGSSLFGENIMLGVGGGGGREVDSILHGGGGGGGATNVVTGEKNIA